MRASVWVLLVVLLIEVLALYLPLTGFEINVSVWFKGDALVYEKIFLFIPVRSRSACTVNDAMARVFAIQGGCGENLANLPGITLSAGQLRNLFIGCDASFGYFRYDFQYDINKMLIHMGTSDFLYEHDYSFDFPVILPYIPALANTSSNSRILS
jgi:hypothetical protein